MTSLPFGCALFILVKSSRCCNMEPHQLMEVKKEGRDENGPLVDEMSVSRLGEQASRTEVVRKT